MLDNIDPFFRRLFIVTSVCIMMYLLFAMSTVIIPFLVAFILAYFFNPVVSSIEKFMPRWAAILALYSTFIVIFILIVSFLVPMLWQQLQKAWDYLPIAISWYNNELTPIIQNYVDFDLPKIGDRSETDTFVDYLKENYNVEDLQGLISVVMKSGMTVINNAGLIVLIPILMFYFLLNWKERIKNWREALPYKQKSTIIEIVQECDLALMAFIRGQILVMFLLGLIYAIQLQIIGLELGLIIGMTAGLASFVPYLGFGIGFIAAIIAGLFQFGLNWFNLGLIAGAFLIGQMVEGYILQPFLLGDKIGLSPLWVMFSVLAGAALMGFVGMLIALPVSAIVNVLFKHGYQRYLRSSYYQPKTED